MLGGGITAALPVAGTLGFKYGLVPAGKAVGFVGGNTLRALNYTVVNPLTKIIGTETVGAGVRKTGLLLDRAVDSAMPKGRNTKSRFLEIFISFSKCTIKR